MRDEDDTEGPRRRSDRRRRITILAACVVAALGYAAGSGSGLGDVRNLDVRSWFEPGPDFERAEVVAADEDGELRVELLVAGARGSERCVRLRTFASGATTDGPSRCERAGRLNAWDDGELEIRRPDQRFGSMTEVAVGPLAAGSVALWGAVHPAVTAVAVRLGDGAEYAFSPQHPDGWFAVLLPAGVTDRDVETGLLVNRVAAIELFDEAGNRFTVVDGSAVTRP